MLPCKAYCWETERLHRLHKERVATEAASAYHLAFTLLLFFFALVITFNCPCVCVNAHQESLLVPCNWRAAYSEGSRPNGSCLAGKLVPFVELTYALT